MNARSAERSWLPDALPSLHGRGWWVFMAVWSATLIAALWATVGVLPSVYRSVTAPVPAAAMVGLSFESLATDATLGPPIGPKAKRSGLKRGDRLIAIDDRPVASTPDGIERQLARSTGRTVAITTLSSTGVKATHILTYDPEHYRQALAAVGLGPTSFSLLTRVLTFAGNTVLLLGCAIILLVRRSRDRLAPWASLMMLWMVLPGNYVTDGIRFSMLVVVLAVFPDGRFQPRWSLAVAVVGVAATLISLPLPFWQSNFITVVTQFAAIGAIAARYRRMPPGTGRQQIRWALLGFVTSNIMLAALLFCQFARPGLDDFGLYAWTTIAGQLFGSAAYVTLMLALTVSLLRYQLYGADATISRSVAYGVITLGLLAVFAASEKLVEIMGEAYLGQRLGALAGVLGAAMAAVMIVPLHHRVTQWAERRFRSGLAHLRHGLPLLVGDLREIATPRALADAMLARVKTGVRARHGALVVDGAVLDSRDIEPAAVAAWLAGAALPAEGVSGLVRDRADPLFPLRVPLQADGVGLVGWLLLGPRPDGSFYGREERAALADIADPVARALAIAIERERRETEWRANEAARQDREQGLRSTVDALRRFIRERFDVDVGGTQRASGRAEGG